MDRGSWWATVHWVKSWTRLSNKGKPMSMAGEHGSSSPVAKSSSKQISYEDWWICKKEKEGHLQKGVPQMHTC